MKRFKKAIRAFFMILRAKQFAVITTKKHKYAYDGDIDLNTFLFISREIASNTMGEHNALQQAKDILKKSEQNG